MYTASTLTDVVRFVKENRGRSFPGWNDEQISNAILHGVKNGTYVYAVEQDGELCGIVYGDLFVDEKIYFIENLVASKSWVIPKFIDMLKMKWPDYTVMATIREKPYHFSLMHLDKIYNRISHYG